MVYGGVCSFFYGRRRYVVDSDVWGYKIRVTVIRVYFDILFVKGLRIRF